MSWTDFGYGSAADTGFADAVAGADRFLERHALAVKAAVFYALTYGTAVFARRVVDGPDVEILLSILAWFTVIFAVCTAALGGTIKLYDAVQRRRKDVP